MSYEDTNCPCGDKKERDTMLCQTCMETLKDRREMKTFLDGKEPFEYWIHAAMILLALSRGRKRNLSNTLKYPNSTSLRVVNDHA